MMIKKNVENKVSIRPNKAPFLFVEEKKPYHRPTNRQTDRQTNMDREEKTDRQSKRAGWVRFIVGQ